MVGHCAVRFYVMGERAVEEQASDEERRQMADVVAHSIDRGAVGFSTNRYPPHKLPDGRSIPGTFADVGELVEIAKAVGPRNAIMQAVGANFEVLRAMAETTKGRILFSYGTGPQEGMGAKSAAGLEQLSKYGDLTAITQVRGSGFMFGLQSNLPVQGETWAKLREQNLEQRLAAIRDQETREKLVDEGLAMQRRFPMTNVFYLGDGESPNYTAPPEDNLEALAKANDEHWVETFLRLSDETDGRALFNLRMFNQSLKELGRPLQERPHLPEPGRRGRARLADHGRRLVDLHLVVLDPRSRAVQPGRRHPAHDLGTGKGYWGLNDRGTLKSGLKADINVFDPDKVAERQPVLVHDFPGGAPRYIQKSMGYKTTIVNGEVTLVDGEHTGTRAGKVLRHAG